MVYTSGSVHSNIGIGVGALNGTDFRGDGNTAVGKSAGANTTTGYQNVYMGYYAAASGTTARHNVVIGNQAGQEITTCREDILIGANAGRYLTTGRFNVLLGAGAGYSGTSGEKNIFVGYYAGRMMQRNAADDDDSANNVAIGNVAMYGHATQDTVSDKNVAVGDSAMYVASGANNNTALGWAALSGSSAGMQGDSNVAIGLSAMGNATNPYDNVSVGNYSGYDMTTGFSNTLVGYKAGTNLTDADSNVAIGKDALTTCITGDDNVAIGERAGSGSTGAGNIFIGRLAGENFTSGNSNVAIGKNVGPTSTNTASNKLYIHNAESDTPLIEGDFGGILQFNTGGNAPDSFYIYCDDGNDDGVRIFAREPFIKLTNQRADPDETWKISAPNDVSSLQFNRDSEAKTCIMGGSTQVLGTMFGSSVEPAIRGVCIASGASYISLDNTTSNSIYRTAGQLQINTTEKLYVDGNIEVNGTLTSTGVIHASSTSFQNSVGEVLYRRNALNTFDINAVLLAIPNIQYVAPDHLSVAGASVIPTELPLAEADSVGLEITVMQTWAADPSAALSVQKQTGSSDVIYEGGSNSASSTVAIDSYRGANKTFIIAAESVWVVKG